VQNKLSCVLEKHKPEHCLRDMDSVSQRLLRGESISHIITRIGPKYENGCQGESQMSPKSSHVHDSL